MQEIRLPITIALTIELNIVSNNKTDIVSGGDNVTTPVITYTSIDETLKPTKIVTKKESDVVDPVKPVLEKTTDEYARDLHTEVIRKRGRPKGSFKRKDHVWNHPIATKHQEYNKGFQPEIVLKSKIITCANPNCHRKLRFIEGTGFFNESWRSLGEFCCTRCAIEFSDEKKSLEDNKANAVRTL